MSLFKTQMFTEDAVFTAPDFDREADAYSPRYGNRLASERQFRDYRRTLACEPSQPVDAWLRECRAGA